MQTICKGLGALGISCTVQQPPVEIVRENFTKHLAEYGFSYGTKEEFEFRFAIYHENDKIINELNAEPSSFVVGHNRFSTLTKEEYNKFKGKKPSLNGTEKVVELDTSVLATEVDWRTKGVVNKVQDQGQCGSCWAFSSTAAIESSHAIQKGELLKLSEQQFVDCSKGGNEGCNGGLEIWAFQYAEKSKLELESDYGYTARDGKCKYDAAKSKVGVTTYAAVPPKSVA